jgi:pimeloyl-ACP methyl ester carboxylesterase
MVQQTPGSNLATSSQSSPNPSGQEPAAHDLVVDNDGVQLAVRDHGGDGPPVLLLHGLTQNLECWAQMVPALRARHRVVAMDLRCHGHSTDGPFTWDTAVSDTVAVTEALGLHRPAIVGHSLGGMVAAAFAATEQDCFAAVNLDGTGNGRPELWPDSERAAAVERAAILRQMASAMWPSAPLPAAFAEQIGQARTAAMATAGMSPSAAARLWDRSLQAQPDGTVLIRPSAASTEEIANLIETADLVAMQAGVIHPLLVVQAGEVPQTEDLPVEQRDALPAWLHEHLEMINRTNGSALAALASRQPQVDYHRVELTHALIIEDPIGVAGLVLEFLGKVAEADQSQQ